MINSRNKGASFERHIASLLNVFFINHDIDFKCKRNLEQYQEKNLGDLTIPNHTIECKRYSSGNWYKEEWWEQTVNSCKEDKTIPVLIWKYNRQPIRVCIPMHVLTKNKKNFSKTVVLTFEDWLDILVSNL
jgi:hypothetical protein|tara:strand:- start:255 stop:647 length:393 start_codon:yes stop_codon:yes gene_type:complete